MDEKRWCQNCGEPIVLQRLGWVHIVQWAPSGNAMEGIPSTITDLLAEGDRTWGYGYGPGWSMIFYHPSGDVKVEPGQWVTRHDNGTITVTDAEPEPMHSESGANDG